MILITKVNPRTKHWHRLTPALESTKKIPAQGRDVGIKKLTLFIQELFHLRSSFAPSFCVPLTYDAYSLPSS